MQLDPPRGAPGIRHGLGAAVCMLLAATAPSPSRAADDTTPGTRLDASTLYYGENKRTTVLEPTVRVTRLFANGQSLSGEFGLDAMTGASPTGEVPNGTAQTVTSASGEVTTLPAGQLPTRMFRDVRGSFDGGWEAPIGTRLKATTGVHFSQERDYRSLGATGSLALDLFSHRLTLTGGGGFNRDRVDPVGGTAAGLTENVIRSLDPQPKNVSSAMIGLSQVMTRRWLLSVNGTRTVERGYLTEPYKVISVLDGGSGEPTRVLRERRPEARTRNDVLMGSAYHLSEDVLYSNYRYYWDDWGVRSHTIDLRYRHDLANDAYLVPHVRLYGQSQADFFAFNLIDGTPLPAFASSDERLGPLRTLTFGATYGFRVGATPGEWSVRGEWMHQWGKGHPGNAPGVESTLDQFPPLEIGTLLVGYSLQF